MANKTAIVGAIAQINRSLQKGFNLLNESGQLTELRDEQLPGAALHIVRALEGKLSEIDENAKYDGMSYEEIVEAKEREKQDGVERNLQAAADELRALKTEQEEIVEDVADEQAGDQDTDSPDGTQQNPDA